MSLRTLATGARQFVVQDALDTICCDPSSRWSLTPTTMVASTPLPGAEMMTFLAPPLRCALAASVLVKTPVDSMT